MSQMTKRALADSLKRLLETRTLEKITIKEIVEDCGVNRQTFYYHFRDVYDLLDWIFTTEGKAVANDDVTEDWETKTQNIFTYLENNHQFIINTYHSIAREQLERYVYREMYKLIYTRIQMASDEFDVTEADKQFIANFFKFAFTGLILEWIRCGMQEKSQKIVERIVTLMRGEIRSVLEKFDQHNSFRQVGR